MAKKKKTEEVGTPSLETILFNCREYLRSNASLNDKRDLLLTLVFLRFIGEKFEDEQQALREQCLDNGMTDEDEIKDFLDQPGMYSGVAFVPAAARWADLILLPPTKLNASLDDALTALEDSGETFKGCVRLGLFTSINLEANVIKKVMDEVSKISHKTFGTERDLIGRVYEYFLKSFAINATKEEGEFYTPHDIVELIAAFIEPFDGTLYDPCCGSGGMFVQCAKYVEAKQGDIMQVNVYGQEADPATYRLAKMNLAMRGISHHLGERNASTFMNDMHRGLTFDYIMANPPFNLKKWYDVSLSHDARWADYGLPPEGNANYAWILHMLSKLRPQHGVAGFLLANGALGDADVASIRQKLIEADKVEAIIVLPRELFYTTDISVTLWILNQNKRGGRWHDRKLRSRQGEVLFMDLRSWTDNPVKGEQKKKVMFTEEQIKRAVAIYHGWQAEGTDGANYAESELYRSVEIDELRANGFSLVPSRYIEFVDRDSQIDYQQVLSQTAKSVGALLHVKSRTTRPSAKHSNNSAMTANKTKWVRLGNYIELCDERNSEGKYSVENIRGISTDKTFIDTKANMEGVSVLAYKVVRPHIFAYVADTSRRGDKIALALNTSSQTYLISSIYSTFRVVGELLPEYLYMLLRRGEFDRYARFNSWGSANLVGRSFVECKFPCQVWKFSEIWWRLMKA